MVQEKKIWIAKSDHPIYLYPSMANRHGLIAGATGTGKTITMKVLAESFSDMGVPVFFSDVKGDLSGMCQTGSASASVEERIQSLGLEDFNYKSYPTKFWDIFGEKGHPVRVTISDMGPVFLSKLLGLTDAQSGVLNIAFKVADDHGLLLLDLKDLKAMLTYLADNRSDFTTSYGNISNATVGAILRKLLTLSEEGGDTFFGEPALDIRDWMRTDPDGRGTIHILNSTTLIQKPGIYSTFLLWMLSELFEKLPEVGDLEKPRMIFFFDEAHLLFQDIAKPLLQKIIQVVKLIRSKGVGIYFISQSPADIPDEVLAQLSNRIQHALRAYTPSDQKAVKAAADAFRENPAFKTKDVLMELGVGEALVSCLDDKGIPSIVERAFILPPHSQMGPAENAKVQSLILSDEFELKYREMIDRESAYEILQEASRELEEMRAQEKENARAEKQRAKEETAALKQKQKEAEAKKKIAERAATNAMSSLARSVSTNMINSVTGGKTSSGKTIAKRAASSALSSVMRSGSKSIIRGLFGNTK